MRIYNDKATITQNNPDDGGIYTQAATIKVTPCFFERRQRSIIYNQEFKQIGDVGMVSPDSYSMYIRAGVTLYITDTVTLASESDLITYKIISYFTVAKSGRRKGQQEVSLEKA